MKQIHIVMISFRKKTDWRALCAFKSWLEAENYVIENQRQDEQNNACLFMYKILTCGLKL